MDDDDDDDSNQHINCVSVLGAGCGCGTRVIRMEIKLYIFVFWLEICIHFSLISVSVLWPSLLSLLVCLCWLLSIRKFHFGCVDAFRSTSLWQDNYHAHVCVCSYDVFFVSAGHMLSSACVTNVADKPRNITIRSFRIYLCVVKKHTKAHTKHITRDRTPWTGLNMDGVTIWQTFAGIHLPLLPFEFVTHNGPEIVIYAVPVTKLPCRHVASSYRVCVAHIESSLASPHTMFTASQNICGIEQW